MSLLGREYGGKFFFKKKTRERSGLLLAIVGCQQWLSMKCGTVEGALAMWASERERERGGFNFNPLLPLSLALFLGLTSL